MTKTALIYAASALAEIAGCYSFWIWAREGRSAWWLTLGVISLIAFAGLLTLVDASAAGRTYAAYGAVYIVASLGWLWRVEGIRPDGWDVLGAAICLVGGAVIMFGPRTAD